MVTNGTYFDVLNISNHPEAVDMIQAFMGSKCLGTFFQNGSSKLYFSSGLREEINIKLKALFKDQTLKWEWDTLAGKEWHLSWKDHFQPVVIENKLVVIPYWENDYPVEFIIRIKPGMAFGTGHHETTWLMLSQMLKYLQLGMSVLDLGTGSGILSIAAKKMGANRVDSVELDIECKTNFYENLELNGIKDDIQFHNRDVLHWDQLDYDLILANINRNVIEKLIPRLHTIRGLIILSGLLITDYEAIKILCQKHQFQIKEKIIQGEWICLIVE